MPEATVPTGDVPALRKGLAVLELLASDGSLTLVDIQRRGSLNKTMTFRILRVLREADYVRLDPLTHRYSLALKLLKLGAATAASFDIITLGQPVLDELRQEFGETMNLGLRDGGHVVYVAMAESNRPGLRMASHVGGHGSLHSTSIGKAMLAFLPENELATLLEHLSLPAVTAKTLTDPSEVRAELEQTRRRGYAIDDEENEIGARCIGVPILDNAARPLAAISISGPIGRIRQDAADSIAERLWRASWDISRRLGQLPATADRFSDPIPHQLAPAEFGPDGTMTGVVDRRR